VKVSTALTKPPTRTTRFTRELADLLLQRGQQRERGGLGGGVGLLGRGVLAHLAGDDLAGGVARDVAREEDEVARADRGHVVRDRGADRRELQPARGEAGFGGLGAGRPGGHGGGKGEREQEAGEETHSRRLAR
jgi:hypothetical protein